MQQIGIWRVTDSGPVRVKSSNVGLEERLEAWIINDPHLLQAGLIIVGKQIDLGQPGRADLLALDQQGQWVVVEIKRGTVYRDTIAQALDYASALASMTFPELVESVRQRSPDTDLPRLLRDRQAEEDEDSAPRDVRTIVVGTGQAPGLQRMIDYLVSGRIPIEVVLFQVFELADGDKVLVREIAEQVEPSPGRYQPSTVDALMARATQGGIGWQFQALIEAGRRHGLYLHPWKHSVMLAPPANRSRCLLTFWANPVEGNKVWAYVAPAALGEFFGVPEEKVKEILGFDQWVKLSRDEVQRLIENLDRFFEPIEQPTS